MNCRPGDIARVLSRRPEYQDMLVSVLYEAPVHRFRLPDGHMHDASPPGCWVIESLGRPFEALTDTGVRQARFGVGNDKNLRPIRDADGEDEVIARVGKPEEVSA